MNPRKLVCLSTLAIAALLAPAARGQFAQQGGKLVANDAVGPKNEEGWSVALSADGNTAIVGGEGDGNGVGASWIYVRANGVWTQQGAKLVGSGAAGGANQGAAVALSADGNTALIGGPNDANGLGAVWVFTRSGGVWTQQGTKLVGTLAASTFGTQQGFSVALSQDGNTALVGGPYDNFGIGALWVYTRAAGVWTQQGAKITPVDPSPGFNGTKMGWSVALSADGNTALTGAPYDSNYYGTVWVFVRAAGVWSQQGTKIFGDNAVTATPLQGTSVALSADGNTALVGGPGDDFDAATGLSTGAAWVFTRSGVTWAQGGSKLVGTGATNRSSQGHGVALSGDGNTALIGGPFDSFNLSSGPTLGGIGATWVFTRANATWTQQGNKLVGAGSVPNGLAGGSAQGYAVAISGDSNTLLVGGPGDNTAVGAAWPFARAGAPATHFIVSTPALAVSGTAFNFTVTALDANNNAASYIGTIHFTSSDAAAILPANSTLTGGVGTFTATLKTNGNQTITATDTISASIVGTSAATAVSAVAQPTPVSVSPAAGSGASQSMTFTFADAAGFQNLGVVNVLVNGSLDGRKACYLAYSRPANVLYLVGDDGGTLLGGAVLTAAGSIANSQCTVSWAASPVTAAGNSLVLALNMTFTTAFAGNRIFYMAAGDVAGNNSGWQQLGVWQVPGGVQSITTSVVGMSPARGNGLGQNSFSFTFSDTKGYQDLGVENILVNNAIDGRRACYLAYARSINVLYLVNDTGDALLAGQVLGAAGSVSNSQCLVSWSGAPVSGSGNNLVLTLSITFTPAFGGNRVFFLAARDINEANNTGWNPMGTWTVQ